MNADQVPSNPPQQTFKVVDTDNLTGANAALIANNQPYGVVVDYKFNPDMEREIPRDVKDDYEPIGEEYVTIQIPVKKYRCTKTQKVVVERHAFQTVDKFVPYSVAPEVLPGMEEVLEEEDGAYQRAPKAGPRRMRNGLIMNDEGLFIPDHDKDGYPIIPRQVVLDYIKTRKLMKPVIKKQRRRIVQMVPGDIEYVTKEREEIEYIDKVVEVHHDVNVVKVVRKPRVVGVREVYKEEQVVVYDPNTTEEDPNNIEYVDYTTQAIEDTFEIDPKGVVPEFIKTSKVHRKIPVWSGKTIYVEVPEHNVNPVPIPSVTQVTPYVFEEVDEEELTEEEKRAWYGQHYEELDLEVEDSEATQVRRSQIDANHTGFGQVVPGPSVLPQQMTEMIRRVADGSVSASQVSRSATAVEPSAISQHHSTVDRIKQLQNQHQFKLAQDEKDKLRLLNDEDGEVVGVVSAQHPVVTVQAPTTYHGSVAHGSQVAFNPHGYQH